MTTASAGQPDRRGASVLIPVLNEERHIVDSVAAMRAQRYDGDIEFLFMDGGSDDRTRDLLEELAREDPRIRILDNPARRTTAGLNIGLRNARGEFVVRMDAHAFYPPNYIAQGIERLARGDTGWVSGPAIPQPIGPWSRRVALALATPLGVGGSAKWLSLDGPGAGSARETELDTGVFAGVWRTTTLDRLGGWDESWPVNQDSELAARYLEDGGRIVCMAELAARYVPRNSLPGLARQYWRYGFYRCKTSRRHPASMRRSHLLAPGLALTVASALAPSRRIRPAGVAGLSLYAVVVAIVSAKSFRRGAAAEDAVTLPAVFAVMHLSWGVGFIMGSGRFGPPWRAIQGLVQGTRG